MLNCRPRDLSPFREAGATFAALFLAEAFFAGGAFFAVGLAAVVRFGAIFFAAFAGAFFFGELAIILRNQRLVWPPIERLLKSICSAAQGQTSPVEIGRAKHLRVRDLRARAGVAAQGELPENLRHY